MIVVSQNKSLFVFEHSMLYYEQPNVKKNYTVFLYICVTIIYFCGTFCVDEE